MIPKYPIWLSSSLREVLDRLYYSQDNSFWFNRNTEAWLMEIERTKENPILLGDIFPYFDMGSAKRGMAWVVMYHSLKIRDKRIPGWKACWLNEDHSKLFWIPKNIRPTYPYGWISTDE